MSGYYGFKSKAEHDLYYSDIENYKHELPSMEAYAKEAEEERLERSKGMDGENTKGPFIVWQDFGYDGWKPESFPTLKLAVDSPKYSLWIITKTVEYEVKEVDG